VESGKIQASSHKVSCSTIIRIDPWAKAPVISLPKVVDERTTTESTNGKQWKALDLFCGIPVRAMPKEGTRTWGREPVTEVTIRRAEDMILEGSPNAGAHLSLYRAFTRWRNKTPIGTTLVEALVIFAAYLDGTGLKKTTCVEYVLIAKRMALNNGEKFGAGSGTLERVLACLRIKAALEKPKHAVDITEERLIEILGIIEKDDVRFQIWLMANCGARTADLLRLDSIQMSLKANKLTILYRVTKTNREPGRAHEVTYEVKRFEEQWREFMQRPKPCELGADAINKILHKAGCPETTYSFRRFFVHNTIERFTEDGHTDWCRVIELTDHEKVSTVKNSYQHHIDDAARNSHVLPAKKRQRKVPEPELVVHPPQKVQLTISQMFASKGGQQVKV